MWLGPSNAWKGYAIPSKNIHQCPFPPQWLRQQAKLSKLGLGKPKTYCWKASASLTCDCLVRILVLGPYFFENKVEATVTVKWDWFLMTGIIDLDNVYSQQDEAMCHTSNVICGKPCRIVLSLEDVITIIHWNLVIWHFPTSFFDLERKGPRQQHSADSIPQR